MRKIFLLLTAMVCMLYACKKVYHSTNPTPDNYRLNSYTKVTSQNIVAPSFLSTVTATPNVTENYSFIYDNQNRLSQEFYTSNDINAVTAGMANLTMKFIYNADTIYKVTSDVKTSLVKEMDTFIINSYGQIINAYFPNETHTFSYYGKLLANESVSYRDTNTVITANLSYTSNNGDLLYRLFGGNLSVSFWDTGIRPDITPLDTVRDTILSLPLTVTWTQINDNGKVSTITHNGVNGYSDALSGYDENYLMVNAVDANGVYVRTGFFPAGYTPKQFYQIYDYLTNRPGDYLQLESFARYGVNIYQNVHMIKAITTPYFTTHVTYNIDADSKVSTTSVTVRDSLLKNTTSYFYTLQWDTR